MEAEELCQVCKTAPAAVHITQVINGQKQHLRLCEACAEEKGGMQALSGLPELFDNVMSKLLGRPPEDRESPAESLECPSCHLRLEDVEKHGLLGCAQCYETFRSDVTILLRRIHGSVKHIGSRPRPQRVFGKTPDLNALKRELHRAIEQEDFEHAAEFRDLIRNLERELMSETP